MTGRKDDQCKGGVDGDTQPNYVPAVNCWCVVTTQLIIANALSINLEPDSSFNSSPLRQNIEREDMPQFRKKPVVIEAVQLRWGTWSDVCELLGGIISEKNPAREITIDQVSDTCGDEGDTFIALTIPTLEGGHVALHGDWIIKGVKGEFYPCKPDIFEATYEPMN